MALRPYLFYGGIVSVIASLTIVPDGGGGTIFNTKDALTDELSKSWAPQSLGDAGKAATFYGGIVLIVLSFFL